MSSPTKGNADTNSGFLEGLDMMSNFGFSHIGQMANHSSAAIPTVSSRHYRHGHGGSGSRMEAGQGVGVGIAGLAIKQRTEPVPNQSLVLSEDSVLLPGMGMGSGEGAEWSFLPR